MTKETQARKIFAASATEYSTSYSTKTDIYNKAEREISRSISLHLLTRRPEWPMMLEIGAGTGQSTVRIESRLNKAGITKYTLLTTDLTLEMIQRAKRLNEESLPARVARVPQIQVSADKLCFPDKLFEVVYGSMVIHWVPKPEEAFEEALRVLIPGGLAVFSSSGMLRSGQQNYVEQPVYQHYVEKVHGILVEKGWWPVNEPFILKSQAVGPVLDRFSPSQIAQKMVDAGFTDVDIVTLLHPVDKQDMLFRMGAGAASMYVFGGSYAAEILPEVREEITNEAIRRVQNEIPDQLDALDQEPAAEQLYIFSGTKPE